MMAITVHFCSRNRIPSSALLINDCKPPDVLAVTLARMRSRIRRQEYDFSTSLHHHYIYLKVTIVCRYIFQRFCSKTRFASTKFCDLYAEMVQGRQILMFYTTIVHIANVCGYKILRFWANPQKY